MPFPNEFLWGVATASYQVEGSVRADGRGDSVWDMACRREGFVRNGDTGEIACDHHRRMPDDVALLSELGVNAYRFSIAWPRVMPDGPGPVNEAGIGFYDRLVDELLARGITPLVTLYHWDMPTALFNRGGWLNAASPAWFAEYTAACVRALGDRVKYWLTLNEPQCFIGLGHALGFQAPGLRLPRDQVLRAAHNVLLSHGRGVRAIREHASSPPLVGWAPVGWACYPETDGAADVAAARRAPFEPVPSIACEDASDVFNWSWWTEPVLEGRYPETYARAFGPDAPDPDPGDMDVISEPIDILGFNFYHGKRVRAGADGQPEPAPLPSTEPKTTNGWPITPDALYWALRFYSERYDMPMIITENGRANDDFVSNDGEVHDPQRVDFLARYISAMERALDEGADLRGYCCWTLMDNFEWQEGYSTRFGLVHVDYTTQQRRLKDSARWYRNRIAAARSAAPAEATR